MRDTTERLLDLIAAALEVDRGRLDGGSSNESVPEWDSLGQLKICLAVEEEFGISFDMDTIARASSVAALREIVNGLA